MHWWIFYNELLNLLYGIRTLDNGYELRFRHRIYRFDRGPRLVRKGLECPCWQALRVVSWSQSLHLIEQVSEICTLLKSVQAKRAYHAGFGQGSDARVNTNLSCDWCLLSFLTLEIPSKSILIVLHARICWLLCFYHQGWFSEPLLWVSDTPGEVRPHPVPR